MLHNVIKIYIPLQLHAFQYQIKIEMGDLTKLQPPFFHLVCSSAHAVLRSLINAETKWMSTFLLTASWSRVEHNKQLQGRVKNSTLKTQEHLGDTGKVKVSFNFKTVGNVNHPLGRKRSFKNKRAQRKRTGRVRLPRIGNKCAPVLQWTKWHCQTQASS